MNHMSSTQLIVAGTHVTTGTADQLPSDLGKPFGQPIVLLVLTEADARARLTRVLDTTESSHKSWRSRRAVQR
jgi:hypothetical protein